MLKSPATASAGWRASSPAQKSRGGPAPVELVPVFLRTDRLAVRHVEVDDPDARDGRRDHALLFVREVGQRRHDVVHGAGAIAHDQRDAVVRALSGEMRLVSGRGEVLARKLAVLRLGFLQAHDVRPRGREPVEQARQAHVERVDVPGGELQGGLLRCAVEERKRRLGPVIAALRSASAAGARSRRCEAVAIASGTRRRESRPPASRPRAVRPARLRPALSARCAAERSSGNRLRRASPSSGLR